MVWFLTFYAKFDEATFNPSSNQLHSFFSSFYFYFSFSMLEKNVHSMTDLYFIIRLFFILDSFLLGFIFRNSWPFFIVSHLIIQANQANKRLHKFDIKISSYWKENRFFLMTLHITAREKLEFKAYKFSRRAFMN